MPKIQVNLNDVPDKVPQIAPGEQVLEIIKAEMAVSKKGNNMLVIEFKVNNDSSKDHGRAISDYIGGLDKDFGQVRLRRLCKSAGMTDLSAVDTSDLVGKSVKAILAPSTYTADDGTTQENTKIKDYLF